MNFKNAAEAAKDYVVEQRRWFHQHPELSWQEFKTTDKIEQELKKMGYDVVRFGDKPGCYADLDTGKPGKTILLRADIDALSVTEKTGYDFASVNAGGMPACGHAGHLASLLGAAKILMENKDTLAGGKVRLFFQPAEETACGVVWYMEEGKVLEGVDAVMSQHIWGGLESPYINFQSGRRMACCDSFTLTVNGVSAHGTNPHLGRDALVAAASIIMNLQTFVSRVNNPLNPLVLTVGTMNAGQSYNTIPNKAVMTGCVRTYDREFRATVTETLKRIVENTAVAMGVTAELEYKFAAPAVINDHDDLNKIAHNAAVKMYGEESLKELPMMMASEDFAYLMEKVPGIYGYIGSYNVADGLTYTNHNDKYSIDESSICRGVAMYAQFAADYLEANA